jgi:hypothetical protein
MILIITNIATEKENDDQRVQSINELRHFMLVFVYVSSQVSLVLAGSKS